MRWYSIYRETLPECALLRDADCEVDNLSSIVQHVVCTLGQQVLHVAQQIGMLFHEHQGTRGTKLLIGVSYEHHVARQWNAGPLESDHRHQLGDSVSLHVDCAASPDIAVPEFSGKGTGGP